MLEKLIETNHSKQRWKDKFSFLDINTEWKSARKATAKERKRIRLLCKVSSRNNDNDITYYIGESDAVFVCSKNFQLITVIPFIRIIERKTKVMSKRNDSVFRKFKMR